MRQVLVFAGLTLAAVLTACADEVRAPAQPATLEPDATATPAEPEVRHTGIAEVDAVLDVLFSGDEDAVRAMVRFTAIPCEAKPAGLGSPPKCHPDEPDGSSVDIFLESYCEGTYVRPEDMARAYVMLATTGARLYAVYRALDTYWPAAQFVAIYTETGVELSPGDAYGVSIADGRIVGTNSGCGDSPEEFIEGRRLGDAVLYSPPEGITGIWDLDIVLDALRLADVETLDQLIRFQSVACVGPTPGNLGGPPLCQPDEPDGTLLAVLPASSCESYFVRREEIEGLLESVAEGQLYAVYRQDDRHVAILSREHLEEKPAMRVSIERRHIVRVDFTCLLTPEEALAGIDPADILVAPAATATPAEPEARHTGIADLDTIIDAVGAGDEEALRELIRFESLPCVGPTPGNLGGPPLCSNDETPGEIATVLRGVGCHGDYGREAVILRSIANLPHDVYAVVRETEGYHIVYSLPPSQIGGDSVGAGLRVQNGRITALTNRCAQPAEAFVETVAPEDFVLPPLAPDTRHTGIAEVDAVLDVLFSGDADAVRDLVSFTAVACEAEPIGLGAPPMCRPDEPDGAAVDVYPHAYCEGVYIRPEDMDGRYLSLASPDRTLYAVYRAPEAYWPPAQYVVIYTDASAAVVPGNALAVSVEDGRIVGSYSGCAGTPEEFIASYRLEEPVLPPLP